MLPYFDIGPVRISCYYLAMVLGYVFMIVLMLIKYRREKYGLNRVKSFVFATLVLIFGVAGCKILYILENLSRVARKGLTLGGFSFFGAVMLIPLCMPLFAKPYKMKVSEVLDSSAVCIVAMLGTIRIGCYLNGCCGGRMFTVGQYSFSLPAQLIECILDFIILFVLLKNENSSGFGGRLYPRFLLFYGAGRFFIEFIRDTEKDWLYLSHAQWFSAAAVIIGIAFETGASKKKQAPPEEEDLMPE